jgi:hypothetical protein
MAEDLRRELDDAGERLERRIVGAHDRIGALEADLGRQHQASEQARKASVKREITVQALGTALFVVGVVLRVLGSRLDRARRRSGSGACSRTPIPSHASVNDARSKS